MKTPNIQIRLRGRAAEAISMWSKQTTLSLSEVGQMFCAFALENIGDKDVPSKLWHALHVRGLLLETFAPTESPKAVKAVKPAPVKKPAKKKK